MKKLYFLIFIVVIIGCSKPDTEYNYLNSYEESFANFKIGSYWIYQNDSSFAVDSVFVKKLSVNMEPYQRDGYIISRSEHRICNLGSSIYPDSIYFGGYSLEANKNLNYFYFNYPGWSIRFSFHNDVIGMRARNDTGLVSVYIPTIVINGNTYNSVYEIPNYRYDSTGVTKSIKACVVSKIGIIKWEIINRNSSVESWSLLRSNIIL